MNRLFMFLFMILTFATASLPAMLTTVAEHEQKKYILQQLQKVNANTINTPSMDGSVLSAENMYPLQYLMHAFYQKKLIITYDQYKKWTTYLLKLGANPTVCNYELIKNAAKIGDIVTLKELLQYNNTKVSLPSDILLSILDSKNPPILRPETTKILELLIEHGANINAQDQDGETVLFEKYNAHSEILDFLLRHPTANLSIKNHDSKTFDYSYWLSQSALQQLANLHANLTPTYHQEYKNTLFGSLLIKACLDFFNGNDHVTLTKMLYGDIAPTIQAKFEKSFNKEFIQSTLIPNIRARVPTATFNIKVLPLTNQERIVVAERSLQIIQNIKPQSVNDTCIQFVPLYNKWQKEIKDLYFYNSNPRKLPLQALILLKLYGHLNITEETYKQLIHELLEKGADPTLPKHESAILLAAQEGNFDVFSMLLQKRKVTTPIQPDILLKMFQIDTDSCIDYVQPVNHTKFTHETYKIVETLLNEGVDPNLKDTLDRTVIDPKYYRQRSDIYQLLLQKSSPNTLRTRVNKHFNMNVEQEPNKTFFRLLLDHLKFDSMSHKEIRSLFDSENQEWLDQCIKKTELQATHNARYNAAERQNTQMELTQHEKALIPKRLKKFEK